MKITASRAAARRALVTILLSAVVGWGLFVLAIFTDMVVESGLTSEQLYGFDRIDIVRPSKYLIFAAIALVALAAVYAKNRMRAQLASPSPASRLTGATEAFAGSVIIITLVMSALMALSVFMSSFFDSSDDVGVVTRVLDAYLPIVLFTALAVTVLLAGFVFTRHLPQVETEDQPTEIVPMGDPQSQRTTALAFTVPIVAVAAALIFGLIVYDLTQNTLPVWIWVVVQAGVGAGIVAGTVYAAQATEARRQGLGRPTGASLGAKNLNLVLSIVFAGAVTLMSLGYGAAAVEQLRSQPTLALNSYAEPTGITDPSGAAPLESITIDASGSDLARNSEAKMGLTPGGGTLATTKVDSDGFLWISESLPTELDSGEYSITLTAEAGDGEALELELTFVVDDEGTATIIGQPSVSLGVEAATLLAPSLGWVVTDLLPALLMVVLAALTLYVTLTARNRDATVSPHTAVAAEGS